VLKFSELSSSTGGGISIVSGTDTLTQADVIGINGANTGSTSVSAILSMATAY